MLTNANHVLNKLDELFLLLQILHVDIIAITESWLSDEILDSVCSFNNYHLVRKDRQTGAMGGGVMLYIANSINFRVMDLPPDDDFQFEILWISLRPKFLYRPLSILIVCVVYSPPWYDCETRKALCKYIVKCVDTISCKYPNAGFFIMGDFNNLETNNFNKFLHFKQVVLSNTRSDKVLDKIFTNCNDYYHVPIILPPLGKSDHNCVLMRSQKGRRETASSTIVERRNYSDYALERIAEDLRQVNWLNLYRMDDCQQQTDTFYAILNEVIDNHAPVRTYKIKNNDRPWITTYFKELIVERNRAYKLMDKSGYKKLRNKTNHLRKTLQHRFYCEQLTQLKSEHPRKWWKCIKQLCGMHDDQSGSASLSNMCFRGKLIDCAVLPDVVNDFLVSVSADVPILDQSRVHTLRSQLDACPDNFIVDEWAVYTALKKLNINKSTGPDFISNKFLKETAEVISAPLCAIINSSIRQGLVPNQWKISRVTLLPKCNPPINLENDIRPIAITSCIAKLAESFVSKHIDEYFKPFLDKDQFGCVRGRSAVLALIKILHVLYEGSDNCDNFIRVLFVDFSKAFDLIDHNILLDKLVNYNFPPQLALWSASFLTDRKQFVRIDDRMSSTKSVTAGTPQGTLAGPSNFKIMINDLSLNLHYVKYVDDTTVASISHDPHDNALQIEADKLLNWCNSNGMTFNTKKTKEMIIHFGNKITIDKAPTLKICNVGIERVESFKLLGVYLNSNLTWDDHVSYILKKVAKRMYFMQQLVRCGIDARDFIVVYCSLIRSVIEYACQVWHPGLTKTQSDDLERVQKRCLRLIYPELHYTDALAVSGLEELKARRENLTRKLFCDIKQHDHVLHEALSCKQRSNVKPSLRDFYPYELSCFKTNRACCSFINYCISKRY